MRVALIGQAAFGAATVDALQGAGHSVVAVSAPLAAAATRTDQLWEKAEALAIPVIDTRAMARQAPGWLGQFKPDLAVMAFVTAILPRSVLDAPELGTIEYHPSLLPRHRGRSAVNWAIIQGETRTGLTIFWVDEGIDTGPILLQKEVEIGPTDTVGSLYFQTLFPLGVEALVEAVGLVERGDAPRIVQDDAAATYEPPCEDEHAAIDWAAPAQRTFDLVRGTNPQPGAHTMLRGGRLRVYDAELRGERGEPGVIEGVDGGGLLVGLPGGSLYVSRVAPDGQRKADAGEWAAANGVVAGESFNT
ncbi:MAG: methionyl-tRNA formyltransferase [Dehalococcoidia bacterium]|nr:methionyl-tRNA formyltransferase [Dehalococcoidia bacterium]